MKHERGHSGFPSILRSHIFLLVMEDDIHLVMVMYFLFVYSKFPLPCCAIGMDGHCRTKKTRKQERLLAGISRQAADGWVAAWDSSSHGHLLVVHPIAHSLELHSFKYLYSYSCQQDFGGTIRHKKTRSTVSGQRGLLSFFPLGKSEWCLVENVGQVECRQQPLGAGSSYWMAHIFLERKRL